MLGIFRNQDVLPLHFHEPVPAFLQATVLPNALHLVRDNMKPLVHFFGRVVRVLDSRYFGLLSRLLKRRREYLLFPRTSLLSQKRLLLRLHSADFGLLFFYPK